MPENFTADELARRIELLATRLRGSAGRLTAIAGTVVMVGKPGFTSYAQVASNAQSEIRALLGNLMTDGLTLDAYRADEERLRRETPGTAPGQRRSGQQRPDRLWYTGTDVHRVAAVIATMTRDAIAAGQTPLTTTDAMDHLGLPWRADDPDCTKFYALAEARADELLNVEIVDVVTWTQINDLDSFEDVIRLHVAPDDPEGYDIDSASAHIREEFNKIMRVDQILWRGDAFRGPIGSSITIDDISEVLNTMPFRAIIAEHKRV